jgi:hypothetical protein
MIKVNGYYKVGNEIFYNKISALVAATNTGQRVSWIYHDDAYNRACSTFRLYDN